ncbi:MAG TPA: hypothetical protein DF383_11250 [Deltaproteobacteria bacterium]|nr:hypothetical protein [Deltaproteobacteria bacterium]
MKKETEYRFRKRIKELESRCGRLQDDLFIYRDIAMHIMTAVAGVAKENASHHLNLEWLILQLKRAMR